MNIYFSGIGGVAIGPLCMIALDAGYEVQGSDTKTSLVTESLVSRGVPIFIGEQDGHFLKVCHTRKPIDLFVYTSALPNDHPELALAGKLGIRVAKRDELIRKIVDDKKLDIVAVAGTHGKTTTTGMLIWALKQLGLPVSYSLGSTISFGQSGEYDSASRFFVYECDEFDRNFLHFSPYLSLVTSVDYDHPDTYPTENEYLMAFRQFIRQSHMTIMWQRDNAQVRAPMGANWLLSDSETQYVHLPGAHNRQNATLVIKALEYLGFADNDQAKSILKTFPGTDRRFERLTDNLYSDYGHHPVEIAATLQMARELSDSVVLVYQPHQNVRQHEVKDDYATAFELAEKIYWLPTYLSREVPELPVLSPEVLSSGLSNHQAVEVAEMNDDLYTKINKARNEGKLVLAMGAGNIDAWLRSHL